MNETIKYEDIGFGKINNCENRIVIPIGKNERGEIYELPFDHESYMVLGRVASGKSSLIHTIVLNGSIKYSPKELQFWLADCKTGLMTEFYNSVQIPHVVKNCEVSSIYDFIALLVLLRKTINERLNILKEKGLKYNKYPFLNLNDYNHFVNQNNCDEPLSKIMVIVDEIQQIFFEDSCSESVNNFDTILESLEIFDTLDAFKRFEDMLAEISMKGPCVGVHLILLSQNISFGRSYSLADAFIKNTRGKISFNISQSALEQSDYGAVFINKAKECMISSLPAGECFCTHNDDCPSKIKVAYATNSEVHNYLKTIAEKYIKGMA